MGKRFQYPAIIRTKRNFLLLCAGVAAVLTPAILWDLVPPQTPIYIWLLLVAAGVGGNFVTGLFIWQIIGPAVSTGTRFVLFTEPTPPQEPPLGEPEEK